MVKTSPAPTFVMSQSQLLLQLLVVAFDNPTVFRSFHQLSQCGAGRESRKPVLGRFALPLRPFDQQPFFVTRFASPIVPMSRSHSQCRKTGAQFLLRPLTPRDRSPILGRQRKSHLLDRNRLMFSIPAQQFRGAPQPASWFCREWSFSRSPNRCVPAHANNIRKAPFAERLPKLSFIALRCIGQHRRRGNSSCQRLANMSEGNHRLGCKGDLFRNTSLLATLRVLGPGFR